MQFATELLPLGLTEILSLRVQVQVVLGQMHSLHACEL